VNHTSQWFGQRRFFEREIAVNANGIDGGNDDEFRERPLQTGDSEFAILPALMGVSGRTVLAPLALSPAAAVKALIDSYPISDAKVTDPAACLDHRPGKLVTKYLRLDDVGMGRPAASVL
jgi:hypothetical protein